jgi:hypothetical protein
MRRDRRFEGFVPTGIPTLAKQFYEFGLTPVSPPLPPLCEKHESSIPGRKRVLPHTGATDG